MRVGEVTVVGDVEVVVVERPKETEFPQHPLPQQALHTVILDIDTYTKQHT